MRSKKNHSKIFVISGPSGSGKTTLLDALCRQKIFRANGKRIITATTRKPRNNERDGRDYVFLTREEFLRKKKQGYFAETQEVFGNFYGTPRKSLTDILRESLLDAFLCVDVKGAFSIRGLFPKETVLIFVAAPNLRILNKRLKGRLSEESPSMRLRLEIAKRELKSIKNYDYLIVNKSMPEALSQLLAVITAEKLKIEKNTQ